MKRYGVYRSFGLYNQYTILELEDGYNVFLKNIDGNDEFVGHTDTLDAADKMMEEHDKKLKEEDDDKWYIIDDSL